MNSEHRHQTRIVLKPGPVSPAMWRLFVGLQLPREVKEKLQQAVKSMREAVPDVEVRWTRVEQCHVTLKFLGNVAVDAVPELVERLNVAEQCSGMRLRVKGIGFFPGSRAPRVVWAGVEDPTGRLEQLARAVSDAIGAFAEKPREEEFKGHITLGRCRGIRKADGEALNRAAILLRETCFGEWDALELELVRSDMGPNGSRYSTVASAGLQDFRSHP